MSNVLPFSSSASDIRVLQEAQPRAYAQPQVDLDNLQPTGFEILARWQHPERGLLFPHEVLPLLPSTQAHNQLTRNLIDQTLPLLHRLERAERPLSFAFNVLLEQLAHPDFADYLIQVGQDQHGVQLTLEVTEQAAPHAEPLMASCLANLQRVRDQGWKISQDDFGTGLSTYARLCALPVDELKIERHFIRSLGKDRQAEERIVRHLVELAQDLGLDCVAEGIEFAEQVHFLRDLGCPCGQGYLFGAPMPLAEVGSWYAHWRVPPTQPQTSQLSADSHAWSPAWQR
ncbi:EAL domain-containing protein [Pseudomonas oryzihabitans]|uniref:EAL domain-containing protein n=1 Tax=Pseudomonas oryzihabitans TaxID=47885 RepID=UPI00285D0706|nr:EAL domain-containing protein [Pseudomonas psychrotolerans]MDR6680379.1 EAL domain-containing protein (putative c-di-GMP-specific phosphodiesterase class I) [Pseudomonas psychrotolerans]